MKLDFVFVRVNKLNVKINYDDILVIESLKDYIKIVTKSKNFIVHTTLTSFTESLPKNNLLEFTVQQPLQLIKLMSLMEAMPI